VSPQGARFLDKARQLLDQAETMLHVGLYEAAGRTAYLAGYHAAQAFIFERVGKVFKSHAGVQTEFLRLTKDDPRVDGELRTFLTAAVEAGKRFVARFAGLVTSSGPPDQEPDT
jgi:uncharacterized protein (UPF0332 family)